MAMNDNDKNQAEQKAGFTCPHYESLPGKKRCRHYLEGGSCARPEEFMCVEWLKLNKKAQPSNPSPKTPGPTDLFGNPVPEPKKPKRTEAKQRPTAAKSSPPAPIASEPVEEREPLRGFTTEDIDGFKALGVEVCLESEAFGEVWLVPKYTEHDRKEITPEHAATIARVMEAFPGSKVVSFEKSPQQGKEAK